MKIFRLLILVGFAAALIALFWQARTIADLRTDVAALRNDLRRSLAGGLDEATGLSSDAAQGRREKLELIKLRNQVRELRESLAASHGSDRRGSFQEALRLLMPAPRAGAPERLRPEWKGMEALATNNYAQAMKALAGATNEYLRFLALDQAAKMSLAVGRSEEARRFATDMMALDEKYSRGSPEQAKGDVVHDGNLVLGRIAVDEGQLDAAKRHLLAAGKSTGSPVLGGFGPNMGLAKDLLEKGEQETVLQYLELCGKFWSSGKLDEWIKDIHAGRIPDFGANLIY